MVVNCDKKEAYYSLVVVAVMVNCDKKEAEGTFDDDGCHFLVEAYHYAEFSNPRGTFRTKKRYSFAHDDDRGGYSTAIVCPRMMVDDRAQQYRRRLDIPSA